MRRQASGVERASNETTNTFQRQQTTGGSWFVMRLNNGDIASPTTTYLEREAFRIEDKYLQYIQVGTRSRECHTSEFRRSSAGWLNESLNQSIK